ncbi:uncharacterized protein F4822DRAFT_65841 [Hypoxylon trugodes]|uniref:uncharacterized protein n=1 Tax=Hypoxylon trugodes TaxID=326681 RepID=UPI002196018E|nr:uncharacterized protein F4822DRAFT_65841 [Hypoxylon trugodes]KAI1384309.1 hypothetical protein F4822DRAFT_65841 [Hypoxylon trugodes]
MHEEPFDGDCGWQGGNVGPWGPADCGEPTPVTISVDDDDDDNNIIPNLTNFTNKSNPTTITNNLESVPESTSKSLQISYRDRETLSEFEALMLGELSNDGSSEDDDMESSGASSADDDASSSASASYFPFMELPLEIRLQVYHWLHLMNPIRLTQFAPWYPIPIVGAYYVKAVTLDLARNRPRRDSAIGTEEGEGDVEEVPLKANIPTVPLLSPWRPHCCMPTAMLRANRQVYYESRGLPFQENEFVFVNWFASGLWAARSFIRGLRPWQAQTMRYARLELLSRDLLGRYAEDWRELCGVWSAGLRGLRLKILGGGGASAGGTGAGGVSWVVAGSPQRGAPTVRVWDNEDKAEEWIENGLKRLKRLRCLEVELSVADWDDKAKVDWCRCLEEAVNESKADGERHVRVSCVERKT